jgi:AraC family transcriptional regulator
VEAPAFITSVSACAQILWCSPILALGTFKAGVRHPEFATMGSPEQNHLLAFSVGPGVWIRHPGKPPFVADPTVVTFYNPGQEYRREKLSEEGDQCAWVALHPNLARELITSGTSTTTDTAGVFPFTHGPSPRNAYLIQRMIACRVVRDCDPDDLLVEELLLEVVSRATENAYWASAGSVPAQDRDGTAALVRDVHALVAARYCEPLSLQQIAQQVGSSAFRLCRVFRRATGWTIHSWLTELRLRASLQLIPDSPGELTGIAMQLGFSSHPHFTASFRARFGITPSQFRHFARASSAQQLRQFLKPAAVQPPNDACSRPVVSI